MTMLIFLKGKGSNGWKNGKYHRDYSRCHTNFIA